MSQGRRFGHMVKGGMCDRSLLRNFTQDEIANDRKRCRQQLAAYLKEVRSVINHQDLERFKVLLCHMVDMVGWKKYIIIVRRYSKVQKRRGIKP